MYNEKFRVCSNLYLNMRSENYIRGGNSWSLPRHNIDSAIVFTMDWGQAAKKGQMLRVIDGIVV